jgi:hypothetical protein
MAAEDYDVVGAFGSSDYSARLAVEKLIDARMTGRPTSSRH